MSIQNKKLNIVSDTNFDGNKITDAKINAQENSISNLETSNFKSDVIQSVVRDGTYATNTSIPTEKAVSDALDKKQDGLPEQSSNSGKYLTTDGTTVSWGEVNANYLYDTKVLSQAISNKGWAYQCKSVRTDLAKADVPTVYNDIEYKYLNCDKVPSSSLIQLTGTSPYRTVDIDDTYVYSGDSTDWKLKRTRLDNLPSVNWETVVNSQLVASPSYRALCVGEKILIASFRGANNSIDIKVYKKSDWTLLKTYTHTYNNGMQSYCSSIYIGSVRKFVIGYKDTDSSTNSSYMVFVEDNDTLQETAYTLPYQQNCIPVYINGYYIFMHRNKEQITKYITRTTDFINFENVYSYNGWSYDNVQPIGKAGNKLMCFQLRYVSSDNGETWVTDNSLPSGCDASSICQKENSFYVISGNKILFSDNLPSFTTVYTGENNLGNFITVNDSADMFFIKKDYPLYFLGYNSVVYTDNYTINGSTVNIQYYKYNDWKICIAGENGTDDINLDTVFDYLGYLNYWRLNRNGQTVTLPRNSNLYTQMFVGDDYDDTEDNLITADWSATALKSELDLIPDQTGNSGKFLTTDGSTLSWSEVQDGDSLPDQTGQTGKFLTTDGTTASWATVVQQSTQVNTFNGTLTSNTLSLNTEIDLSDTIILAVYVNGIYQIDSTHYSITTSGGESTITFTSAFNEDIKVSIVYATNISLTNLSYNDLIDKPTIDTLLPSQTGQSGKFLTTNGSTASWTTVSSGTTDYTDLTNKPSINGVTLTGNVSLSSLGVQSKNLVFENTTADSWVISDPNVYPDYIYECTVSCPGATTNSFAQVVFGPGEFDSGNYANVCSTGQDSVTMYSKVNDTINIPTIIIMGV